MIQVVFHQFSCRYSAHENAWPDVAFDESIPWMTDRNGRRQAEKRKGSPDHGIDSGAGITLFQRRLFALAPQTEQQRWLRSNALEITSTIAESRWTTVEQALAGPIFMMLEMDEPYSGLVKIPSASLRVALDQLGQS